VPRSCATPGRMLAGCARKAALVMLGGAAPIGASSGKVVRHRRNRSGDRQLNRALHTVVLSRMAHHAETRAYVACRTAEGKTPREIKRCLIGRVSGPQPAPESG
jgi:transposase